jgi:16S rRNA (cytosine967-C5)-methyltransferase
VVAPARRACYETLQSIELHGSFSDEALHSEKVSRLRAIDRNLVTEITYGTLRWRGWLDCLLAGAVRSEWEEINPKTKILLRMSLYQMARMSRLPDYAVINDAVELAKRGLKKSTSAFVNGVLRRMSRERPWTAAEYIEKCPPWSRLSLPEWLWQRWQARFGIAQAERFVLSLNRPPDRAFRLITRPGQTSDSWVQTGIHPSELVPGAWLIQGSEPAGERFGTASVHFQDEASQLVPHLLEPLAGRRVWDACAAPGGKSAILGQLVLPDGMVVSSDVSLARVLRMRDMLGSTGNRRHELLAADATRAAPFRVCFDAVLVDAPCSGLGTVRRNPEIKWRFRPARLELLHNAQTLLLDKVAGIVRTGGTLLYVTCSTEPEENEEVVDSFLASHPQFRLERPANPPGVVRWLDKRGFFRSFPSEKLWDGFFAALMVRVS